MDRPSIFASEPFTTALEKTRSSPRLLIVDASAEWRGPCKHMDRTTWRDPDVITWFDTHAVALQIDVDQAQEWAKAHRISSMPMLIAFKAGAEFDRVVGAKNPRDLLAWLDRLVRGETETERLRVFAGEGGTRRREETRTGKGAALRR